MAFCWLSLFVPIGTILFIGTDAHLVVDRPPHSFKLVKLRAETLPGGKVVHIVDTSGSESFVVTWVAHSMDVAMVPPCAQSYGVLGRGHTLDVVFMAKPQQKLTTFLVDTCIWELSAEQLHAFARDIDAEFIRTCRIRKTLIKTIMT
jgi:hypothetical protein